MKYRTGTLYNQKHAVWCKHPINVTSSCPLCPQLDNALHILSGCQNTQIRNIITERHNLACSMIFKAISKTGFLGFCFVCMNTGSSKRLVMQNLQIPDTAETRIIPKWLFPSRVSDKIDLSPAVQMMYCLLPSPWKQKSRVVIEGGCIYRRGRGQLRGTGSSSAAPPAISRSTFSGQHRPKGLSIPQGDIHHQVLWGHWTAEPAGCPTGAAQRPLLHPSRSLRYPAHHPAGSRWHYWQQSHGGVALRIWVVIRKELQNMLLASKHT